MVYNKPQYKDIVLDHTEADSWGKTETAKVHFENIDQEVKVKPHNRDGGDLAILKVEGVDKDFPFDVVVKRRKVFIFHPSTVYQQLVIDVF